MSRVKKSFWLVMKPILISTGLPVEMRFCSANNANATKALGLSPATYPYIMSEPSYEINVFDGEFTGTASVTIDGFELSNTNKIGQNFDDYVWDGCDVTVYTGLSNASTIGELTSYFVGVVEKSPVVTPDGIKISLTDKLYLLDKEIFTTTYLGTGGMEGTAEMEGVPKPFSMGYPLNIAPVLVDPAYLIYQYHGYGTAGGVLGLYENGLSFGAGQTAVPFTTNNATTFAALRAKTLTAGQWADCPSLGMFRLGGEPVSGGVISADVAGFSSGGVVALLTDVINKLVTEAGQSALVDASSYTGFQTATYNQIISDYYESPINAKETIDTYLSQVGGYSFINSNGKIRLGLVRMSTPSLTIRTDGTTSPVVEDGISLPTSAPYKRVKMGADRVFKVHALNEISDKLYQTVFALNTTLSNLSTEVYLAASDTVLTIDEKIRILKPANAEMVTQYNNLTSRATALGLTYASLTTAYNNYITTRNAITPAWDNITVNSTGINASFRGYIVTLADELIILNKRISEEDAKRADWVQTSGRPPLLTGEGVTVDEFLLDPSVWAYEATTGAFSNSSTGDGWFSNTGGVMATLATKFANATPIDPSASYEVSIDLIEDGTGVGTATSYLGVALYDANGSVIGVDGTWWHYFKAAEAVYERGKWETYSVRIGKGTAKPFPANASKFGLVAYVNYNNQPNVTCRVRRMKSRRVTDQSWTAAIPNRWTLANGRVVRHVGAYSWGNTAFGRAGIKGPQRFAWRWSGQGDAYSTMCGLSETANPVNFTDGVFIAQASDTAGGIYIYEGGTLKASYTGQTDRNTAEFAIEYDGLKLQLYKNGVPYGYSRLVGPNKTYYPFIDTYYPTSTGIIDVKHASTQSAAVVGGNTFNDTGTLLGGPDLLNTEQLWSDVDGAGRPADNATASDNLVKNGSILENAKHWTLYDGTYYEARPTGEPVPAALVFPPSAVAKQARANDNVRIPTDGATRIWASGWSYIGGAGSYFRVGCYPSQTNGTATGIGYVDLSIIPTVQSVWQPFKVAIDLPANTTHVVPYVYVGAGNTTNFLVGGLRFSKTEPNATDGAMAGTNLVNSIGQVVTDPQFLNNRVENSILRIPNPVGGSYSNAVPNVVGHIKIRLPQQALGDTMIKFSVDVFDYGGEYSVRYEVAGYPYQFTTNVAWANCSAQAIGKSFAVKRVHFGRDAANDACIYIGETDSVWQYPAVKISNFQASYSNYTEAEWASGWSVNIDQVTRGATTTTIQVPTAGDAISGVNTRREGGTIVGDSMLMNDNQRFDQVVNGYGRPSDNATSDLKLTASGTGLTVSGNYVTRDSAIGGSWTASVYTETSYVGGAIAQFSPDTAVGYSASYIMAGLNTDPTTDVSYQSLDYCFFVEGDANVKIYESNAQVGGIWGTYTYGVTVLSVVYDNEYVRYLIGGTEVRSVYVGAGKRFHFDSSIVQGSIRNIRFGPYAAANAPVSFINANGQSSNGNSVFKVSGTSGWNSKSTSLEVQKGTAVITWKMTGPDAMVGLHEVGNTNTNYPSLYASIYRTGTEARVYESGGNGATLGTVDDSTVYRISYDGTKIEYFINNSLVRTYTGRPAGLSFQAGAAIYHAVNGSVVYNVQFGAYTDNAWASVAGTGRPEDYATVGATAGTNLKDSGGIVLADNAIRNYRIENGVMQVALPEGGSVSGASVQNGAIRIRLPADVNTSTSMINFEVSIYDYNSEASGTYFLSGYIYHPDLNWYNLTARYVGRQTSVRPVYFGRHSDGRWTVWIGAKTTSWSYPKVRVRNLEVGHSTLDLDAWKDGWTVEFDTSDRTTTNFTVANPVAGDALAGINLRDSGGVVLQDGNVRNSDIRVAVDTAGTGGRARARIFRDGGNTLVNEVQLPDVVQNLNQQWADVSGTGRPADDATNDRFMDTRNTNQNPSWYWTNYPYRTAHEFKDGHYLAIPGIPAAGYYGALITRVDYADASGGPIKQEFIVGTSYSPNGLVSGQKFLRYSTGQTTWGSWFKDFSALQPPRLGSGGELLTEGGAALTDGNTRNDQIRVAVDTAGTGGRARARIFRDGGNTLVNEVQLPDVVQNLNQQWADVSGTGKPEDNATVGATAGSNLRRSSGVVVSDSQVLNESQLWSQVSGTGRPADNATVGAKANVNLRKEDDTLVADPDFLNNRLENNVLRIAAPIGGAIATEGVQTGAIKIALPTGGLSTMVRFYVDVYEYDPEASQTYEVGGYTYSDGSWINCFAHAIGRSPSVRTVRFGRESGVFCVYIGELTGTWSYPKVRIRDVTAGYSNFEEVKWRDGWALSWKTSAFPSIAATVTKPVAGDAISGINTRRESGAVVGDTLLMNDNQRFDQVVAGYGRPSDNATSDIKLVGTGVGILIAGNRVTRPTGGGSWDSQAYTPDGYVGGAYCSFSFETNAYAMAGLNTDPTADASYVSLDFCWYCPADSTISHIYESSSGSFLNAGAHTANTVFSIVYDNEYVRYLKDGIEVRAVYVGAGKKYHFDSSIVQSPGITNIRFGPYAAANAPLSFINTTGHTSEGNTVFKRSNATNDWDGKSISREISQGTAFVTGKLDTVDTFIGLHEVGNSNVTFPAFAFSIHRSGNGTWAVYEDGGSPLNLGSGYDNNTQWSIRYDGVNVRYYAGTTLLRTVASSADRSFQAGVACYSAGSRVSAIQFGPYTDRAWANISGSGKPENNATVGAAWGTNLTGRPTELTDGRIDAGLDASGRNKVGINAGSNITVANEALLEGINGTQLHPNPEFQAGSLSGWNVYNNAGGSRVSLAVAYDSGMPNGTDYRLAVTVDPASVQGSDPMPGWGGVHCSLTDAGAGSHSRPNKYARGTFIYHKIRAWIPVGRTINWASNSTGNEAYTEFLTSQEGTGTWKLYVMRQYIGRTGTFSSTGFFYIAGGASGGFTWYIAKWDQIDVTSSPVSFLGNGGVFDEDGSPLSKSIVRNDLQRFDEIVSGNGKPEANADVTLTAQVTTQAPDDVTINADYLGNIIAGQFNKVTTPTVTRGGVSARTDNRATYSVTNITGGLVGFVSVNNTAGSADKGRATITNCTATGSYQHNVFWDNVLIASYVVRFHVVAAPAPLGGGGSGGTGTKSGNFSVFGFTFSTTSFVEVSRITNLTKSSGETIRCTFPSASYQATSSNSVSRNAVVKWQYSPTGANSWTDVGAAVNGSTSYWYAQDFSGEEGFITVNQNVAPSDGAYDLRLVAAMSSSVGGGSIQFTFGTASVVIGP